MSVADEHRSGTFHSPSPKFSNRTTSSSTNWDGSNYVLYNGTNTEIPSKILMGIAIYAELWTSHSRGGLSGLQIDFPHSVIGSKFLLRSPYGFHACFQNHVSSMKCSSSFPIQVCWTKPRTKLILERKQKRTNWKHSSSFYQGSGYDRVQSQRPSSRFLGKHEMTIFLHFSRHPNFVY